MKLLFIFTGGTIGSTASGGVIAPDGEKPRLLLEKYAENYPIDFAYDILTPMNELSENFTGEHISLLLETVRKHKENYDGIIVTHGTDTLAYSAAALGYALGSDTCPVCMVSSRAPIDTPTENGIQNLRAAILLIKSGKGRGVFVPYGNGEGETPIHRATRLSTPLALSDKVFSVNECVWGCVTREGVLCQNPDFHEPPDTLPAPDTTLTAQSAGILRVFPYPGMVYPEIPADTRFILLDTYHSGTVDGKSPAAHAFFAEAKCREIPVFITAGTPYESTRILAEQGAIVLPLSPIAAYMKLWLYGDSRAMFAPRGGDFFK